jgi:hypothetical protein
MKRHAPTFITWKGMRQRCNCPTHKAYPSYGGRGIKVCERWAKYENFLADMGPRPDGMTLDREDNDKGYEPGNCCWANKTAQLRNTRANVRYDFRGLQLVLPEIAELTGIPKDTIRMRMKRGWTLEEAVADAEGGLAETSARRAAPYQLPAADCVELTPKPPPEGPPLPAIGKPLRANMIAFRNAPRPAGHLGNVVSDQSEAA